VDARGGGGGEGEDVGQGGEGEGGGGEGEDVGQGGEGEGGGGGEEDEGGGRGGEGEGGGVDGEATAAATAEAGTVARLKARVTESVKAAAAEAGRAKAAEKAAVEKAAAEKAAVEKAVKEAKELVRRTLTEANLITMFDKMINEASSETQRQTPSASRKFVPIIKSIAKEPTLLALPYRNRTRCVASDPFLAWTMQSATRTRISPKWTFQKGFPRLPWKRGELRFTALCTESNPPNSLCLRCALTHDAMCTIAG
jgi:hypothetical protein